MVYVCNGNEPSLDQLLSGGKAAAALTVATSAASSANSALQSISDMSSDGVLTPVEKPALINDYAVISNEQSGIDAQATAYGIGAEKSNYDAAITSLTNYLGTLNAPVAWNNLTGNTTINGVTLRTRFYDVYVTRQAVLNKIAQIAGLRADWPNVTNVLVTTPQIVQFGATETMSITGTAGSLTTSSNITPIESHSVSVNTLSWSNTLPHAVEVQIESSIYVWFMTGTSGSVGLKDSGTSGHLTSTAYGSYLFLDSISVPPGATITMNLYVFVEVRSLPPSGVNSVTATWLPPTSRLSAIKK
jgi:hypothetical protein